MKQNLGAQLQASARSPCCCVQLNHVVDPDRHTKRAFAWPYKHTIRANVSRHHQVTAVVRLKRNAFHRHLVLANTKEWILVLMQLKPSCTCHSHIADAAEDALVEATALTTTERCLFFLVNILVIRVRACVAEACGIECSAQHSLESIHHNMKSVVCPCALWRAYKQLIPRIRLAIGQVSEISEMLGELVCFVRMERGNNGRHLFADMGDPCHHVWITLCKPVWRIKHNQTDGSDRGLNQAQCA